MRGLDRSGLRIGRGEDGVLVVHKQAQEGDRARLRHEARLLQLVRGPGVVAHLGLDEDEHEATTVLTVAYAGTDVRHGLTGDDRDRLTFLAELARTVARLHEVGIAHGRLDPDHVLADTDRHPVLCGFGDAVEDAPSDRRAADVADLGALVHHLLGAGGTPAVGPVPRRRAQLDLTTPARLIADHAQADDPDRRPSATTVAERLEALTVDDRTGSSTRPGRRRRALVATGAITGLGALAAGVAGFVAPARPGAEAVAAGDPTRPSAPPAPDPSGADGTTSAAAKEDDATCAPPGAVAAGAVTPPCPTSTPVEATGVELDGSRYRVGDEGDEVLVTELGCDGPTSVLLIRPDGSVFGFPRRAEADQPVNGVLVASAAPGSRLWRADGACPGVGYEPARGGTATVDLEALRRGGSAP